MTIEQIKKVFGVDLTTKERKITYIYLRSIYAHQHKKTKHVTEIAKDLQKDRTSIIHLFKSYEKHKLDPLYELILKCYIKEDKDLIKKANKFIAKRVLEQIKFNEKYINTTKLQKVVIKKPIIQTKIPNDFKRPHIFEVAKNLRYKKTPLNNIPYNKWDYQHFKEYEQIIKL